MIRELLLNALWTIKFGGSIYSKLKATFVLSLVSSPIAYIAEQFIKWGNEKIIYITFVLAAIIVDHALGSAVHLWHKRDFSFKKNIVGLLVKISLVVAFEIIMNGIYSILGAGVLASYLSVVGELLVLFYPAGSALMNMSIITKGKFPPTAFIDRIKRFNNNLDPSGLAGEAEKNQDNFID